MKAITKIQNLEMTLLADYTELMRELVNLIGQKK